MFTFKEMYGFKYIHLTNDAGRVVASFRSDKITAIICEADNVRRLYVEGVPPIVLDESQARQLYKELGGVKVND